jgi:single-strand DNA-binding protein
MTNVVILIGRLCADPKAITTSQGTSVASFSIAVDTMPDKAGNKSAYFFNVSSFKKVADTVLKYCHKGDKVCLNGRLVQRHYKDKDGKDHSDVSIVADSVDFLTPKSEKKQDDQTAPAVNDENIPF